MTLKLVRRRRQYAAQMQAEVGCCEDIGEAAASSMSRPAFIEPAQPKAGFDTSADGRVWFAIWNAGRNLAVAIDASPDELETCRQSLQSARRGWGDEFAGPFNARQQAEAYAAGKLVADRKRLDAAS